MPTVSGFISVADLVDGQAGATIVLSNENHTFIASALGVVDSTELSSYNSTADVYIGSDVQTYTTTQTNPGSGNYTITSTAISGNTTHRLATATFSPSSNVDLEVLVRNSDGQLTIRDANTGTGFVDESGVDSVIVTLSYIVTIGSTPVTYNRAVSFTKARGGSAPYVRLSSDAQIVPYDFGASTPKVGSDTVVFSGRAFNFTGSNESEWTYSVDGGSFSAIDEDNPPTGITFTGNDTNSPSMTVTHTAYNVLLGSGNRVTFRLTHGGTQFDEITVAKLQDAEGAYNVIIEVIGGSSVLKNNPQTISVSDNSTYCDLEARIYRSGVEITTGLTYSWRKNNGDSAYTPQHTQPSGYGATSSKIRLSGNDVSNNGADVFSCQVTTS